MIRQRQMAGGAQPHHGQAGTARPGGNEKGVRTHPDNVEIRKVRDCQPFALGYLSHAREAVGGGVKAMDGNRRAAGIDANQMRLAVDVCLNDFGAAHKR